jgi:hypothetical protein
VSPTECGESLEPTLSVLRTDRVKEDYLPATNAHLTLIQDDLVYVFRQSGPDLPDGIWEGETLGVTGMCDAALLCRHSWLTPHVVCFSFPAKYVEVAKTLDHEIAASSMGKKK